MKRSTSGWTTAIAAAALLGFPGAGLAQTPATPHTPSQPPATQSPAAPSEQAQSAANTPAEHIAAAKQALASIDSSTVPASVKPQLAQLRTHLNNLEKEVARGNTGATASAKGSGSKWGTEAADVDKIVTNLVGAEGAASAAPASEPSATGTSGRNTATLDDGAKDKLRDVRRHVTEMAASMSGAPGAGSAASAAAATSAPATASPDAASAAHACDERDELAAGNGAERHAAEHAECQRHRANSRRRLRRLRQPSRPPRSPLPRRQGKSIVKLPSST